MVSKILLFFAAAALAWAQFPTDGRGIVITGLPAAQDNLLGPLIQYGSSPWIFGDLAEKETADNMMPAALAEAPALGTALSGTVSLVTANQTLATTANLTGTVSPGDTIVAAWDTVDGVGTGRALCGVSSITSTTITCGENLFEPSFSGVTAYKLPGPDIHGYDFQAWTTESPIKVWNYYDVSIGLYRLYYRTGTTTYLTNARQYADIQWQWVNDHGYRSVRPRAAALVGQFFRALDGHPERFPYLYAWIGLNLRYADPSFLPQFDAREGAYMEWFIALGAKTDTDATRHTQYCSWLSGYTTTWNSKQQSDGSWGEDDFSLNAGFVSAVKSFAGPPFIYPGAPWRQAINIRALEAAYESLNDTTAQGCNNTSLAASTLTAIANAVTWQNNYGRDTSNRGAYYEVNSQSDDQGTVGGAGTVSINTGSTTLTGVGTNFVTAGYNDGTHFIGIYNSGTVYKIASCSSNTSCTLSVAFGLFSEASNVTASGYGIAGPATSSCHSSASFCGSVVSGTNPGDRNLTRTMCSGMAWLYAKTFIATYLNWADECASSALGGPTAGPTNLSNIDGANLPCSGPSCDGFIPDTFTGLPSCLDTGGVAPCIYGGGLYGNLGKNWGEAFGAPGIDNELGWRLFGSSAPLIPSKSRVCGKCVVLYVAPPEPQIVHQIHRVLSFLKDVFYRGRVPILAASIK